MAPSVFTWIKQLNIKTLQLSSAQWKGKKKATYAHPSVFHTYSIIRHFLKELLLVLSRTYLGNAVVGDRKQWNG